jgi:hypothetical protein
LRCSPSRTADRRWGVGPRWSGPRRWPGKRRGSNYSRRASPGAEGRSIGRAASGAGRIQTPPREVRPPPLGPG